MRLRQILKFWIARFAWTAALGVLPGCSWLPPSHVVSKVTPYYKEGPKQPGQPDGFLNVGDGIWLMRNDTDGYSRVWLKDGATAHVWTDSLTPRGKWEQEQQAKKSPSKK